MTTRSTRATRATRTRQAGAPTAAPLLLTADEGLLGELLPLVAAADITPTTVRRSIDALADWSRASVVLVGADLAEELLGLGPERRPHVYLLSAGRAPDELFRTALHLGAEQVV